MKKLFNYLLLILLLSSCILGYMGLQEKKKPIKVEITIIEPEPSFMSKSAEEGLLDALYYYDVKHPSIVYAQAILETGWFKSNNCVNNNNLFGLYDSKNKRFYKFDHWTDCVVAYINMIQYRYNEGDYYKFLEEIGYAEDEEYINKLKSIILKHE